MATTPTIWFDATTIKNLRNHSPVGLSRVEANVLRGAIRLPHGKTRFCILDRYRRTMDDYPRTSVERLLENYGNSGECGHGEKAASHGLLRRTGKTIERNLRMATRHAIAHTQRAVGYQASSAQWKQDDILVLSGATWSMFDIPTLKSIVLEHGVRLVTLLADMIPCLYPHHFEDRQAVERFNRFIEFIARNGALVMSISHSTQNDFLRYAAAHGIHPPRTEVIHLGADSSNGKPSRPRNLPMDFEQRGYVVSVSTLQVRKNHQLLYHIWRRLAVERRNDIPRLVLVGAPGWLTNELRYQMAHDPLVQDSIFVLNEVDDRELDWLYEHCQFSLYPSLYEGWGLPIVESLLHVKPCIASNTSSMPEASRGLALHLDPQDFMKWYDAILRWISNPSVLAVERERIAADRTHRSWDVFSEEFCSRVVALTETNYLSAA